MYIAILVVVGVVAVYVITTYNQFVTLKGRIRASIQEIGNQLKRQADLIPNLQESVKAYLKQEKSIFTMLTDARKAIDSAVTGGSDMGQVDAAQDMLRQALSKLQVVVESNPEIKSNQIIEKLMNELRDTADKLMYARRTLIDLAADYNILTQTFPSVIIARMFGFTEEKGLEMPINATSATTVREEELKTPHVSLD